jgi:leucine dehydrogenase
MTRALKESLTLEDIAVDGYERVIKITDEATGLQAITCIHSLALGPALGGIRIVPYQDFNSALTDVKRLARGMTYKSAVARTGLGGGKSVIIASPKEVTREMLISFAEAMNELGGIYTCAEDVGCSVDFVTQISKHTPYVVGVQSDKSSGNPAPFTAWGTFRGIQAAAHEAFGSTDLKGKRIAIQGLGSVGALLADILFWHGASLILSDIDLEKTVLLAKKYAAQVSQPDMILSVTCDILAPCALGGIINPTTIPLLKCKVVAGCANNQLLTDADGEALKARGILYAPDFVINAGGLINVTEEIAPEGYSPAAALVKTDHIYDVLLEIFAIARKNQISTQKAATTLAEECIEKGIGKRIHPPIYHHFNG